MNALIIPGLHNSGPGHWQSIWQEKFPLQFERVEQSSWSQPVKKDWVSNLQQRIQLLQQPTILVAHSLGCITVNHWANEYSSSYITGALLVAPADVEQPGKDCFKTFCPVPLQPLPFPSVVVASTNDPYITISNAARLAAYWGSRFKCIGEKGHINASSGLLDWKEGLAMLSMFDSMEAERKMMEQHTFN